MARGAIIDVSLTAKELKLVLERVKDGGYVSENDMIRDGLRRLLHQDVAAPVLSGKRRFDSRRLAAAYRATSAADRKLAGEWSSFNDRWPNT